MAYLNAKYLSVRQMKRPLSHPIQVCTHNKSRSRLSILFIYFLSHVTSLMEGITFKKMGQHAPTIKLLPFGLFTSTNNYSA